MSMEDAAMLLGVGLADVEIEVQALEQPSDRALAGEEVPQ